MKEGKQGSKVLVVQVEIVLQKYQVLVMICNLALSEVPVVESFG